MTGVEKKAFETWYNFMRDAEGGFANHVADKGGATMRGVTWRTFTYLADKIGYTPSWELFLKMPLKLHRKIAKYYWNEVNKYINGLPCVKIFLADVNWGSGRGGIKALQYFLNSQLPSDKRLRVDGVIGPQTAGAIEYLAKKEGNLIQKLLDWKREHYWQIVRRDPSQEVFINGWLNRVNKLENVIKNADCETNNKKKS